MQLFIAIPSLVIATVCFIISKRYLDEFLIDLTTISYSISREKAEHRKYLIYFLIVGAAYLSLSLYGFGL